MEFRNVLVADIGKSHTRVAIHRDDRVLGAASGAGVPGLALASGATLVHEQLLDLSAALGREYTWDAVSIGVAGALTAPEVAAQLASALHDAWAVPVCVSSDVVMAHIGALRGAAGTVLVAGTGAVALGVSDDGAMTMADGLGPDLGDHGSGYAIGRAGMRAALRASQAPPATVLTGRAMTFTEGRHPVEWLRSQNNPYGAVAAFARDVLAAAEDGDETAARIVRQAADDLITSAVAASEPGALVSILGGLSDHQPFAALLTGGMRAAGLRVLPPEGTALDGAALAGRLTTLPHERLLHRAR